MTRLLLACLVAFALTASSRALAQSEEQPRTERSASDPEVSKRDEAYTHFQAALAHFDRREWSAALAEFLRSREIYPTRAATKDAAVCLRTEGRFDEALELYEDLLLKFPDLSEEERSFAQREETELQASIGTLEIRGAEPGASVIVDGRSRGTWPLAEPLRVSAGSRLLVLSKEGFARFEQRVDIAGRQDLVVDARLALLTAGGRLRVTEASGLLLDVVVDNVRVGKTPWEGTLAVGQHMVVLHGDDDLGTQPMPAPVRRDEVTSLALKAEALGATVRVEPHPANAAISIDGVEAGRGIWEGKLRVGRHVLEVGADGFVAFRRTLTLGRAQRVVVDAELERDSTSALWEDRRDGIVFDMVGSYGLAPVFGGDVMSNCTSPCTRSLSTSGRAALRVGYESRVGLGVAMDAGYLAVLTSTRGRAETLTPMGLKINDGIVDDDLDLSALTLGGAAFFHLAGDWPVTFRLGAGVAIGEVRDRRRGTFTNSLYGEMYAVNLTASDSADYVYVSPEARIGRRFGSHVEISAGIECLFLVASHIPRFPTSATVVAAGPMHPQGDGEAVFPNESLTGPFMLTVAPDLAARYEF
jgi:hypothetical protein